MNTVSMDFEGRISRCAQNVFCSTPSNLDLVKYNPLKLYIMFPNL